ncbi:CapA family protein [Paenibacillus spiritus]|uniref:CapA family protein n=1 Tax=Paenibacillus spiritus TaxID=2496557 RepID=A0A5J5G1R4_9BACL|nr:CapA family protein [Paenibacillus spiritus]KAA8999807.1 CapA family protein [Paenibacillus spiritus]
MYPPRSDRNQVSKRKRSRRLRLRINLALLLLIAGALALALGQRDGGGREAAGPAVPPPSAPAAPSSAPAETRPPASPSLPPSAPPAASPSPDAPVPASATPPPSGSGGEEGGAPAPPPAAPAASEEAAPEAPGGGNAGTPDDGSPEVSLSFAGDTIFAGKVGELLEKQGYDYAFSRLDGMFRSDDLTVVNLETPVTEGGTGAANKQFVFRSSPKALGAMKRAGIDAVNLANNHSLDRGQEGLSDTLSLLDEAGIARVGAGQNAAEAYTVRYFERKGIRIALLGFTRVVPETSWIATARTPGLASVYDSAQALKAIADARREADLVVVMVHWGKERQEAFSPQQQELGRSFIDAGADLVIGSHPHVLQGLEPYKGKWIAYSTGNFVFTRSATPSTWETAVFRANCKVDGQCRLTLKPMDAELGRPVPMAAEQGEKLLKRMEALSEGRVSIDEAGRVSVR